MKPWFAGPFILLLLAACEHGPKTLFSRLDSKDTNVHFINENTENDNQNILKYEYFYNGGGVALGDINNDGLVDIYLTSNLYENKLYLNKGDLQFDDITSASGSSCSAGWKTGVCMVDVNGDGWLDIYVSRSAYKDSTLRKNILLINNKNLTFTDQAEKFGLADNSYSTQASFFDYDHDGDLDVLLLNHSLLQISNSFDISHRSLTRRIPYVGNKLMRNDHGQFVDISDSVGVFGPISNYGLAVSVSDVNNDGWADIFTGSDYTGPDRLLLNRNGLSFLDATDSMLSHISKFTMGADIADFNNDGLMDIYTLDMLPEDYKRQKLLLGADRYNDFNLMVKNGLHYQYMRNMLHLNTGVGYFSEVGQLAGVSNTDWSWSPLFADFDNDGALDLFVSNGFRRDLTNSDFAKYHAFQQIGEAYRRKQRVDYLSILNKFHENRIHNYVFKGTGKISFEDHSVDWGFEVPTLTNGVAYGDLDNDGDLDLVMNNLNSVAEIYRNNNESIHRGHYLKLKLYGRDENRSSIGAKVTVWKLGKQMVRELFTVRGFQSSMDPSVHFGLGEIDNLDSVVIRWPIGTRQVLKDIAVDKTIDLYEPEHAVAQTIVEAPTIFKPLHGVLDYQHRENVFEDFDIQSLLPRKYSTQGPALAKGDFNGDGRNDLFVGGAKGFRSQLLIQDAYGKYAQSNQPALTADLNSEDVDAVFFDADHDGDQDLYVVSGGYEYEVNDKDLQDRLYISDGSGKLVKKNVPVGLVSGSCVRPADIDNDGDIDLFIGGRIVPGRYPECPESYLLINDGKGSFSKSKNANELRSVGMVTDALWVDLNNDGFKDMIVIGEWMGAEIFINHNGELKNETNTWIKSQRHGWWNCIEGADFDGDGDQDFVLGNVGKNNQMRVSIEKPGAIVFGDIDGNGSVDPLMSYFIQGQNYPYASRDEITDQLPSFKRRFTTYAAYAETSFEKLLRPEELALTKGMKLTEMQSCYLRNDKGVLSFVSLPPEAQIAPIFSVSAVDVNNDGKLDFIAAGNLSGTRSRTGKMTGNTGSIFLGDGAGNFNYVPPNRAGLRCVGDVRKLVWDGRRMVVGINNGPVQVYQLVTQQTEKP